MAVLRAFMSCFPLPARRRCCRYADFAELEIIFQDMLGKHVHFCKHQANAATVYRLTDTLLLTFGNVLTWCPNHSREVGLLSEGFLLMTNHISAFAADFDECVPRGSLASRYM